MASVLPKSLLRSLAWGLEQVRARLLASDPLADLDHARRYVRMAVGVSNPSPAILRLVDEISAEIALRERVQERARRVVSDGDADSS